MEAILLKLGLSLLENVGQILIAGVTAYFGRKILTEQEDKRNQREVEREVLAIEQQAKGAKIPSDNKKSRVMYRLGKKRRFRRVRRDELETMLEASVKKMNDGGSKGD